MKLDGSEIHLVLHDPKSRHDAASTLKEWLEKHQDTAEETSAQTLIISAFSMEAEAVQDTKESNDTAG